MFSRRVLTGGKSSLIWMKNHPMRTTLLLILMVVLVQPVSWGATHFLPQDCGHFTTYMNYQHNQYSVPPDQAMNCLILAHQQCRAADITSIGYGVDNAGQTTFSTTNRLGRCVMTLAPYSYTCKAGFFCLLQVFEPGFDSQTCQSVMKVHNGLTFTDCSDGNDVNWGLDP
jgi:hypothetical protein